AHEPLLLVPRLPLHPARRLAARRTPDRGQPGGDDVPGRALARRGLDLRRVGPRARHIPRLPRGAAASRVDAAERHDQPRRHVRPRVRGVRDLPFAEPARRRGRALVDGRTARPRPGCAAAGAAPAQVRRARGRAARVRERRAEHLADPHPAEPRARIRHRPRGGRRDHDDRAPAPLHLLPVLMRSLSVALAAVAALAVAGSASFAGPAAAPTDRSVKLDLIAKLAHGPDILILGDSRGRQAEPSLLRRLTGHTAFNAAVTGGSAPDAWVFTRYTADLFPHQRRRYVWFVSGGITSNIPDPRMEADPRGRRYLAEVTPLLSTETISPNPWQTDTAYNRDGSIARDLLPPTPAQAAKVRAQAAAIAARIAEHPPVAPPPDPARFQLFEHLIAYMNRLGATPVIVLNPVYPT